MKFLDSVRPQIIAATRIVVGFLFAQHGFDKFFGVFGGTPGDLDSIHIVGGAIELVGGALVCIGLQTRLAAFICSGTMAVAYFLYHQSYGPLPIQNDGELAAVYSWAFLLLAAIGANGVWSIESGSESSRA
ncbi:MAG: DoxX family protein [Deltaproteobacteria bacterium]|nr:DoxX family protein [Deltaproteobacteria bacterium]MBW2578894.1 DoxX family protein [Deltaproteobacteria bacterium]MBW2692018.1 DoxX family protein [Deltaproteobacteria bacterium]